MDKYIVEIDGKNICTDSDGSSKLALSVKADNGYAVFCTEIPLTSYTEPDIEQVRKVAYAQGHSDGFLEAGYDCHEGCSPVEKAYQRGLNDAWEAARKITGSVMDGSFNYNELNVLFGSKYPESIINKYSASEAIEKIRQYEQKQEEQIQVGDEVEGG